MEDQGKRVLVAVVLCMLIVGVWSWLFAPSQEQKPQAPAPPAEQAQQPAPPPGTPASQPAQPGQPAPAAPASSTSAPRSEERTTTIATAKVEATFSSWGGALKSWKLINSQYKQKGTDGSSVPMDLVR